jgi:2-polyprenyl-6-methoxyphenol hydroxylase-like FAD-dependent oxidoreductase
MTGTIDKLDTEVVVAGGGPVGLTSALLLARAGISVTLLEQEPAISRDLRASTFHPPTLDMLDTLGLGDKVVAEGIPCPHWQIRLHPSGERAVFDLGVLEKDTRHPYRLQCEQWKLAVAIAGAVAAEGKANVVFNGKVTGFTQNADGVRIDTETGGKKQTLRAKFLIGADGSRSSVRDALGFPFEGETYPETTLLATTTVQFNEHLEGLSNVSYCWKQGSVGARPRATGNNFALLRVPGRWRVSIYPREDMPIQDQLTEDAIEAALQEIVPRPERYHIIEKRPYRVHQRIVPRYGDGRVWLAGDAAHLNSPTGGMGLNGGLHDAFELTAGVIDVLRKGAALDRLTLYDRRRRPTARDEILAQSDRNRARMRERDDTKRREILAGLQAITRDRDQLYAYMLKTSMISGLRQAASIE